MGPSCDNVAVSDFLKKILLFLGDVFVYKFKKIKRIPLSIFSIKDSVLTHWTVPGNLLVCLWSFKKMNGRWPRTIVLIIDTKHTALNNNQSVIVHSLCCRILCELFMKYVDLNELREGN